MPIELVPDVLLAFAYVLVPGVGLCLATRLAAGRSFFTFLALSFGLGYAGVGLVSMALVLLGAFHAPLFGLAWLGLSIAGWAVAVRGGSLRAQAQGWLRHTLADPWAAAGTSAALLGVTVTRFTIDPLANLAPTVLRYWADGLQIADAGAIPQGTLQWGTVLQPSTSKVVLNAFNAGASLFLGRDALTAQAALLVVVAVGLVIVAVGLLTELGVGRLAAAGALLLFVDRVIPFDLTTDLDANVAENWGRLLALSAMIASVIALRTGRASDFLPSSSAERAGSAHAPPIVAGIILGAAASTHLVAASIGLAAVCALATACSVLEGSVKRVATRTGMTVGAALIVGGAILVSTPGDLGFKGAAGPDAYRDLRLGSDLGTTFDPTHFIATHDVRAAYRHDVLTLGDVAEQFAYKLVGTSALRQKLGEEASPWFLFGPTVIALALAGTLLLVGPPSIRVVALTAVLLGIGIFAVGVIFAWRYDLFVLEYFGTRRLFSYAAIPLIFIVTAAGETVLWWLGRHGLGARGASVAGVAAVLLVAVILIPGSVRSEKGQSAELALLRWVGRTVPCEGRVLADHRTLGTFETITGHAAVLEGMGPHVRPSVLTLAIEEIFLARAFFLHPEKGRPYLRERGVAAIVVSTDGGGFSFGGYSVARVPPRRMDRVPYLRRTFENAAGIVYRVEGYGPDPQLPPVAGRPGFRCKVASA